MTTPGPAHDRAAAELARAEADWRATPPDLAGWVSLSRDASKALMAEYDRRGAELDRLRRIISEAAEALLAHWYGKDETADMDRQQDVALVDPVLFDLIYALGARVGGLDD